MDFKDHYVYQRLNGDRNDEDFVVRRSEMLTKEAQRGAFCINVPFKNSESRGGDLALRLAVDGGRAGTTRLRREIDVHSHLLTCAEADRHGLGVAVGADVDGASNIVLRWYRATAPLADPKWRTLTAADRYEIGVHMMNAAVSLTRVGVVHQDICPENVVLRYDAGEEGQRPSVRLWLVDFGHAFCLDNAGPPATESAVHRDWVHPDRLEGTPASHFTDLWECVLTWLDLWSGANQRSATDELGMALPFDLQRDLAETIRSALAAAKAGDPSAPTEILFAMERAFHQELRKESIKAEIEERAPRTGFDLLDLTAKALEERFESEYRLQVGRRAREAQGRLNDLAQTTSPSRPWWRHGRRQGAERAIASTITELSRGNTLQVSTVIEPELRRSLLVIEGFSRTSARRIHVHDPGFWRLLLCVVGLIAVTISLIAWRLA